MTRPINVIAAEIRAEWFSAIHSRQIPSYMRFSMPYLEAMLDIKSIDDDYGCEPADDIVIRFLTNAAGWRGETARRVKAELNKLLESV